MHDVAIKGVSLSYNGSPKCINHAPLLLFVRDEVAQALLASNCIPDILPPEFLW